jgi:hypothetical protein
MLKAYLCSPFFYSIKASMAFIGEEPQTDVWQYIMKINLNTLYYDKNFYS